MNIQFIVGVFGVVAGGVVLWGAILQAHRANKKAEVPDRARWVGSMFLIAGGVAVMFYGGGSILNAAGLGAQKLFSTNERAQMPDYGNLIDGGDVPTLNNEPSSESTGG